jgi:hypothetical protein
MSQSATQRMSQSATHSEGFLPKEPLGKFQLTTELHNVCLPQQAISAPLAHEVAGKFSFGLPQGLKQD